MKSLLLKRWLIVFFLIVFSGSLARAQSGPGSALNLDGVSGYAQVTNGVWFSGDFTVEGWVYVRSYNNWSRLFDFGNAGYLQEVYLALSEGTGGFPKMGVFTNGNNTLVGSSQQLPLNQWAHLAVTLSASTATILINGNPVGSGTVLVPNSVVRTNNYIGRSLFGGDGYANALFDEIRIWNVARTPNQIQAFMHRSLAGNETGLLGYWRMDEATGTTLTDGSGHGQTATLFGGTTWSNSNAPLTVGPATALNFSSTNCQNVAIPHQAALNAYPLTVMAWFMVPTNSNGGALINKYVSSSFNGYQIYLPGHLKAWYFRDSANNVFNNGVMDAGSVNDGLWHHVAMAVDAAGGRLYLDGVLKSTVAWTGTAGPPTTTQPLTLGVYPGDSCFNGQLDEVSIWNTALSAGQIQTSMHRSLQGTESGLLAYYRLDEGSGTNTVDATGHGYNGTLAGPPTWIASGAMAGAPQVATLAATGVAGTSATLNGTANAEGQPTTAWFKWGTSLTNETNSATANIAAAFSNAAYSITLSGLSSGTYHYQAIATNAGGTNIGTDMTFTIQISPPTVATLAATTISTTAATLNASANPGGSAGVYFLWGPTTNYGNATGATNLSGGSSVPVAMSIGGLTAGTSYHFQAVATNAAGTNFGGDQAFSTSLFVQNNAGLTVPIDYSVAEAFGDFNNNGTLDLLQEGDLWVNNGPGNFSKLNGVGPGRTSSFSSAVWFDVDNDGRLDFLTSWNSFDCCSTVPHTQVWHNNGNGTFTLMGGTGIPDFSYGSAAVGDFDNDGRQDLLYMGQTHFSGDNGGIYRNNGDGTFGFITIPGLISVHSGGLAAGDFDNDGYLDFVIVGATWTSSTAHVPTFQMWRNNGNGTFSQVSVPGAIPMGRFGDSCYAVVGDINNDGYLDFVISGPGAGGIVTQVWLNNGDFTFTLAPVLPGVTKGALALADFDNDGVLDIFLTGVSVYTPAASHTGFWKGLGNGQFTLVSNFPTINYGFGAAGDINNDGRLDFLYGGLTPAGNFPISLYLQQNACPVSNTPPSAPNNLLATTVRNTVSLSWNPASDAQTPASALNYNIRIGTNSGGIQIAAPNSDLSTGFRRVPGWGNSHTTSAEFTLLPGHYYWSAQAIDSAWAGSPFSSEGQFTLGIPTAVTQPAAPVTSSTAVLNGTVDSMGGPAAAWFQWGTTTNYGNVTPITIVSGTNASAVAVSNLLTGLTFGVYHFQVVASNAAGTTFGGDASFSVALLQNVASSLPALYLSSVAWGDFNNDGLLDLLLTGATNGSVSFAASQVWQNLGNGSFSNINASLPGVSASSVAWGDFDNDSFLDVLLTGTDISGNGLSQVWHNNGDGTFSLTSSGLPGVGHSAVALADFDNDGRLDILLTGSSSSGLISQVWRNQGDGTFANINIPLPGVSFGSVACNDFDKDGNVDILLTGVGNSGRLTQLWRNNGDGTFSKINAGLPAVRESSVAWADFDSDGFPDILLSGGGLAQVWRNNHDGTFTNLNVGFPDVAYSSVAVGDFDNDGRPDILLSGTTNSLGSGALTRLFRNLGNSTFTNVPVNTPGAWLGSLAWGDYDNDGRLDFLMTGWDTNSNPMTLLWRNLNTQTNDAPAAPTGLAATAGISGVSFIWNAGTDTQSPAAGLTYNVRIGTNSGGGQILSPESAADGFRRVVQTGNAQQRLGTSLRGLTAGSTYYWSVQSVDSSFAGSPFSAEGTFIVGAPGVLTGPSSIVSATSEQLTGSVNPNGLDSTAWFEWGTNTTYGSNTVLVPISGTISGAVGVTNLIAGLIPGTVYHYRLVATNGLGMNRGADSTFTAPLPPSVTTLAATAVVPTSALLNGSVLPNSAPTLAWFQWGASTSYGSTSAPISLSMTNLAAVALSNLLTSLTPNTQYHFLLSASNVAGLGGGGDLTFTTPAPSLPSVTSLPADGITPNRATLKGTAAANGAATAAWFQWGLTSAYGNNTALFPIDATNLSALAVSNSLSGLAGGPLYYYRLAATNSAGTNFGAGLTFTTLPVTAPTATTLAASAVTASGATLNGSLNPNGADTLAWFQFGTNTSYGNATPAAIISSNVPAVVSLSNSVSGLLAGVVYHFQLVASNSVGMSLGGDLTFLPPLFTSTSVGLPNLLYSSAAWGDFNNDGFLDVLLSGFDGTNPVAQVWQNLGNGSFSNVNAGLPGLLAGAVAWGDYDNDGFLDILLMGVNSNFIPATQLWHNNGNGTFTQNTDNPLTRLFYGSALAWGDYDNDGKLDFFLSGADANSAPVSQLWHNLGNGSFSPNTNVAFAQLFASAAAWGDYDKDGRLDLLLTGLGSNGAPVTQLWHNDGNGVFSLNTNTALPAVYFGPIAWGDYDNDGRLDILLTGNNGTNPICQVWHSEGNGVFTLNAGVVLPGVYNGSAAWGDYDSDGRLDILLTGLDSSDNPLTQIWRNNGNGTFSVVNVALPAVFFGAAVWGDVNNDGKLDVLLTGASINNSGNPDAPITALFSNVGPSSNTPPLAPSALTTTVQSFGQVLFLWNAASDSQTPANGLSYNLRIGTTPGGTDVLAPEAGAANGFRRLPQLGNAQAGLSNIVTRLSAGTYYWSVQAIDTSFAGGPFAAESTFSIVSSPPVITSFAYVAGQFQVRFNGQAGGNYNLEGSTNLLQWVFITNLIVPTNGTYQVQDPAASTFQRRFYRLSVH